MLSRNMWATHKGIISLLKSIVLRNTYNMNRGLYASEVTRLAGFKTIMMLNYLERTGLFVPESNRKTHHGKHREYSFRDLVVLRAINRLLEMGARPKRIALALETFSNIEGLPTDVDALLEFSKKVSAFIVNKQHVLYAKSHDTIFNLSASGQMELAFIIDVPTSMQDMAEVAKVYTDKHIKNGPKNLSELNRLALARGL